MTTIGLLASWGATLFGAWAFVAGLLSVPAHDAAVGSSRSLAGDASRAPSAVAGSARRALVAAGVLALIAAVALGQLLLTGDFTVNYVARTMASNVPAAARVAALFQLPAGAVFPVAALVALASALATHRSVSTLGTAVAGSVVMALLAASLTAQPFATLPWVPTDGLGLAPDLQGGLSIVGHAARAVAIACAAAWAARAANALAMEGASTGSGSNARDGALRDLLPLLTLGAIAVAMWAQARGAYIAGLTRTPVPTAAWNGTMVAALAACACGGRRRPTAPAATMAVALGTLALLVATLLGMGDMSAPPVALSIVAALALVSVTIGALAPTRADSRRTTDGHDSPPLVPSRVADALRMGALLLVTTGGAAVLFFPPSPSRWMGAMGQLALGLAMVAVAAHTALGDARRQWCRWLVPAGLLVGAFAAGWRVGTDPAPLLWGSATGGVLGAAVLAAGAPSASGTRLPRVLLLGAVAAAALAALGEEGARSERRTVAVGARIVVGTPSGTPLVLAHQGVSRYQDGNAHVVAVALEATRGGRVQAVLTAQRREVVDGRDERLGPQLVPPALLVQLHQEVRVTLDELAADETVALRLTVVPFAAAWSVAVACVLAAVAFAALGARAVPTSAAHSHASE